MTMKYEFSKLQKYEFLAQGFYHKHRRMAPGKSDPIPPSTSEEYRQETMEMWDKFCSDCYEEMFSEWAVNHHKEAGVRYLGEWLGLEEEQND